jgi:vacuolar-type H+-ATPase subunit E/Vma4
MAERNGEKIMANIKKNAQGYGYKYTDLAAINDYIEGIGETYYQEIERIDNDDYVVTVRKTKEGSNSIRGCRVVQASLSGKVNPAQEQGSGLTYARRYSLLMAYGLATEDDDAESLTISKPKATDIVRDRDAEIKEAEADILARAKKRINEELEKHDYTRADQKKAFILMVLEKPTIDTLNDADQVMDALDNENEE